MPQNNSARALLRDAFVPLVAIFLASRAVLLFIAWLTATVAEPTQHIDAALGSLLCRWDCFWYLDVATDGYSMAEFEKVPGETDFAFYPLFPLLMRAVAPLYSGNALHAGIVVANACFVVALGYVYLYARELALDRRAALLAVWLICVFPQSIAFSAPFTESTFLMLLAAAMYHFRHSQYFLAGVAAALLSATRANGIFFVVFAVAWLWRHGGLRVFLAPWREPEKLVPIVLAPLGMFLFLGYCFLATGDAFAHSSTELIGWRWTFAPPWVSLPIQLDSDGTGVFATFVSFGVAACSLLLLRQKMYEEFAFCAATILLFWCGQGLVSAFRYWLVLFPVWIGVARVLATRPMWAAGAFSVLGVVNGFMVYAWTMQRIIAI